MLSTRFAKKLTIAAMAMLTFMAVSPKAGDFSGKVREVFLERSDRFRFRLSTSGTTWYFVSLSNLDGDIDRYRMIHGQLVTALTTNSHVWVGTIGDSKDVWGTTIYNPH